MSSSDDSGWAPIRASAASIRTQNPIRKIVDQLVVPKQVSEDKPLIALSIGDPTVFGNLNSPDTLTEAVCRAAQGRTANGYGHSCGLPAARLAIAEKYGIPESAPLTPDDVIIASSCSGALELVIGALVNEGDNVLLPAPGFSLYKTLCDYKGCEVRYYPLLADKNWEADCEKMTELIDGKTKAILVNNPSNPCGSVYTKEHLLQIINVAEKHHLPIIADEIYEGVIFKGHKFYRLASLTTTVPVLTVGGLAKLYLVPGWRVGWILIHDRNGILAEVRQGLVQLSQVILGANTLIQSAIPSLLKDTPQAYYDGLVSTLQGNAEVLTQRLKDVEQLRIVAPGGAMYMMVGVQLEKLKDIEDDVDFAKKLLDEELVFVLPGQIFKFPNYIRLVICPPADKLNEACDRIIAFCARHAR